MVDWLDDALEEAGGLVDKAKEGVDVAGDAIGDAVDAVEDAHTAAVDWTADAIETVEEARQDAIDWTVEAIPKVEQARQDAVDWTANAMENPEQALEDIEDFAEDAVEGALLGDFAEDTWGKVVGQIGVGLTPAGVAADVRDFAAGLRDVAEGKDGAWLNLGLAGIGFIPLVGDAIKGGVRMARKASRAADVVRTAGNAADAARTSGHAADAARAGGNAADARHAGGGTPGAASDVRKAQPIADGRFPIPDAHRAEFQRMHREREAWIQRRDELEALPRPLTDRQAEQLSMARHEVNSASRQMGERASQVFMEGNFQDARQWHPFTSELDEPSLSHEFDQVWTVKDPTNSGDTLYVVVESKGGTSGIGTRTLADGTVVQQGTREYYQATAESMIENGARRQDANLMKRGEELMKAIDDENVLYYKVQAPIGPQGVTEVQATRFYINQLDR
jgi:hypothetical protein